MEFKGYPRIRRRYKNTLQYFEGIKHVNSNPTLQDSAYLLARDSLARFLQNDWDGENANGPKGLKNVAAQTRIASALWASADCLFHGS